MSRSRSSCWHRFSRWPLAVAALGLTMRVPATCVAAPRARVLHAATSDPGCDMRDGVVVHGSRRSRDIALTFDACPTRQVPGFSAEIVDYLRAEATPATFFVSGTWAESHRPQLATLAAVPFFEIALHGHRHRRLEGASVAAIVAEITDGRRALERLGVAPQPLFRPPYGDRPVALTESAQRAGVTPVLWDIEPGDPDPHETAEAIARTVLQRARGGSIVVLHVNGRGIGTAAALPTIVEGLRQHGFRFVTVSELIRDCAATPVTGE